MRSTRTLVSLLAASALALTACSGSGASGNEPAGNGTLANGRTFTMSIATDPGSLDPLMTVLSATRGVDRYLYASLINLTSKGEVVSGLAEKWSATTTEATFTLRDGITCSDGSSLTARDVAANIDFVGDPKNKSPLAGIQVMPGTKATVDGGTRTVTVKSGAPDAFLLRNVGTMAIACGKGLTDRSRLAKGADGTGMFTISEIVPNDHYTLTRRKDFTWGPGDWDPNQAGLPDKVVIKVVPNETTAANLLLSGGLNAAAILGPDQDRLMAQKLFHSDQLAPIGELFFNQAPERPTRDEAVRRALVQALDLGQLGKVLTGNKGKPSQGMVTVLPTACTGDPVSGNLPGHDTAAAKAALDAAGWTAGSDGVRAKDGRKLALTVIYGTQLGPTMVSAAELVQQGLKSMGVDVTLKGVDSPGLNEVLFSTGAWDVSIGPVGLSLPSQLVPFVSGPVPPQGTNFAHVQNQRYDALVRQASAKAGAAGCDDWNAAETELIKAVDAVPYYNNVIPTFGKDARFEVGDGIAPTSIRMYE
jgi:peptide/nickel transport system substrate-binding protein